MSDEQEYVHPHLINGEFQSDKYPDCPRGKVPLSVKDATAQDLLWEYAQRRRPVDAQFSADLEIALRNAGFATPSPETGTAAVATACCFAKLANPESPHDHLCAGPAPEPVKPPATHVQTITHGDVHGLANYYHRDCSCGWEGPPRHTVQEVIDFDSCPRTPAAGTAPRPMSGCELVDCSRLDPHTHQSRCEHPSPGNGSCDNCRCAQARP